MQEEQKTLVIATLLPKQFWDEEKQGDNIIT